MSRPLSRTGGGGGARPQSAAMIQAQQIAAHQMALQQGAGGLALGGTGLASRSAMGASSSTLGLTRTTTRPLSATRTSTTTTTSLRAGPRRPGAHGVGGVGGSTTVTTSHFGVGGHGGADYNSALSGFGSGGMGGMGAASSSSLLSTSSIGGAGEATEAPALENEYIVNLQQQVYFLELELNLMKKAGGGGGSTYPTGLGGSGGGGSGSGGMTDANVPDAPLDDVMLSLREKYVRMEAEYKKDMDDLKAENGELRSRARMRELEIHNLKHLHGNLSSETQNWKTTAQDHQSTLLDHQLANEQMILKLTTRLAKREKKLEKALDDLVHLKAEHKVALESYAEEREAYTQKWNDRERAMDALNEALLMEKETNLEWAERFRQSNEAAMLDQIQALEQSVLELQSATKKAELSRDQAEKARQAAREGLDRIMDENEGLRSAVTAMEADKRAMQEKEARDRKSKTFWSAEVASMQSQIVALTEKLNKTQAKYADAKQVKKQLKDELIQSRVYLEELTHRLGEEQDTHNKTRLGEEELNELTRELKRDLTLKTEELQTLMSKYADVKSAADSAQQERDRLHVDLTELQAKFDVHEALQGLKLHEFVTMAHSNLKVAGAIENLMGKMKKGEHDVRKEKGRERDRERERSRERADRRHAEREHDREQAAENDLYSDRSSRNGTPRHGRHGPHSPGSSVTDSRPTTQASDLTQDMDSRPNTASTLDSSFGI